MLTIERISQFSDMKRLEPVWDELLHRSASNLPFLTFDFIATEWENIGWEMEMERELSPFVLMVKEHGELVGLFPFVKERKRLYGLPVMAIRSLGSQYLDRSDAIIALKPQETVEAVYSYLQREETSWNVLYLKNVAEHSPLIRYVPPCASAFAVCLRSGYLSPYVTRRGAWEDYIRNRSKNFRKQLSNKRNKFIKHAGQIVAREYRTPEEVNAALSIAFDVDSKSWKAKEGTAISSTERSRIYWEQLTQRLAEHDRVRIWILWAEERAVAFEYHVVYGKTVYSLKWSYDHKYHQYSPGLLLKHRSMEAFWSRDIEEVDLLGTSDDFKEQWTDDKRIHTDIYLFNRTLYSRFVHGYMFWFLGLLSCLKNMWIIMAAHAGKKRQKDSE